MRLLHEVVEIVKNGWASLSDYVEEEWRAYQAIEQVSNHWDRVGWSDDRRSYHWLVTLQHLPIVRKHAALHQRHFVNFDHLDLVAMSGLHITLQRAAFTDEIRRSQAETLVAIGQAYVTGISPFSVDIGPLSGSTGAVRLSVGPHEPLCQLRNAARAAIRDVLGKAPTGAGEFKPHVSIGYTNAKMPAQPLIERVGSVRHLGTVSTRIDSMTLVELRREDRQYVWESVGVAYLSGS